ncbi:MAG: LPS assembly protein LptD [Deltaproteobacteria bacterium]|nr:LPS assembly protein LptD [Deltaproteobacteria bacterium]MCL5892179.1 LPS assembly protein LptD [Deltaproteobacteria bacterium]
MKKLIFDYIKITLLFLCVISILCISNIKASFAARKPENNQANLPINISANKIVYNKKDNTYIITGNVIIIRKNFRLKADKVIYYYKTDFAIATGNVVVYSKGTLTKAKILKVYLSNRFGTIYNSHIHYLKRNIYVYGKKIYHKGKGFYQVEDGYLTSCSRKPPSWKIYSGFSDIYMGNYAFSYNSVFYIHNVPILYFPIMVTPIKTKKSSGLLIPTMGYSSLTGFQAGDGYYFDLGRSSDLTYYLNYYSFLGVGNSLKYRYSLNPYSHGSIYGFYMKEMDNAKSLALSPSLTRYLLFSHNVDFLDGLSVKTNINVPSDPAFYYDFSTNVYQMTKNRLSSNFSVTGNTGSYSARMNFLRLDNLFFPNYATVDEYPSISFNGESKIGNLLNNPLYFNFGSSLDVFRSASYLNDDRLDLFPEVYLPIDITPGIHITPKAGFRYTGYYNIRNGYTAISESNRNREIYYASLDNNTTLFKDYITSNKNNTGYLAFVTPYVNYDLIRPVNQAGVPLIDQTDYIPYESAFKYGFNFNLEGYSEHGINNLLRFSLYQYHSLSGNFINPVNYYNYNNANSDIMARIKIHPLSNLYFFGNGSYDAYNYIFHDYNASSQITDFRGDSFGIGYTEINDVQGYLTALNMFNSTNAGLFPQTSIPITNLDTLSYTSLSANLKIAYGFSINTSENIDLTIHKDISNSVGVIYQNGCIGFIANYMNLPYFHQWAFSFGIILKGVGTYGFGNMISPGAATSGLSMSGPSFNNSF